MTDKAEKPFWAHTLDDVMTPELAKDIAHDIYRAWTGEEPPSLSEGRDNDSDDSGGSDNSAV